MSVVRPSPNEVMAQLEVVKRRRRQLRLVQVRHKASEAAREVRQRVKREKRKQLNQVALEQLDKFR